MFVVRDWTRNPSYTMVSNDVKDVRDIVIGITGDETIGDHVLLHLGHMIFGQFLVWGPLVIRCVPDEDAQALYLWKRVISSPLGRRFTPSWMTLCRRGIGRCPFIFRRMVECPLAYPLGPMRSHFELPMNRAKSPTMITVRALDFPLSRPN